MVISTRFFQGWLLLLFLLISKGLDAQNCNNPQFFSIDSISYHSIKIYSAGYKHELEIVAQTQNYTGVPTHTVLPGTFIKVEGLASGTAYKCRSRPVCDDGSKGNWVFAFTFETIPFCDQVQSIQCDSAYHILIEPGRGYYAGHDLSMGNLNYGREKIFKFRAQYSDELFVRLDSLYEYGLLEIKDSAVAACFDAGGTITLIESSPFSFTPHIRSLGQVVAGHTYYLIYDRPYDTDSVQFYLGLSCPNLCNRPAQLSVNQLGPNAAQLHWQNNALTNHWEIEIRPSGTALTGMPTHSGAGDSVIMGGLQPLTRYRWQVRDVCSDTIPSEWSLWDEFSTGPVCTNLPELLCNQVVPFTYPGGPEVLDDCYGDGGPEVYARFTPAYDGYYQLRYVSTNLLFELGVSMARVDENCTFGGWNCIGRYSGLGDYPLDLGLLRADSTYIIAVEFDDGVGYTGETIGLRLDCPQACPVPNSLHFLQRTDHSATVAWKGLANQNGWEVQLITLGTPQNDTLTFSTTTPSQLLNGLQRGKQYRWRVRGICNGLGNSVWSADQPFVTPPECNQFPTLSCGDTVSLQFPQGHGYLSYPCSGATPTGVDQLVAIQVDQPANESHTYYLYLGENYSAANYKLFAREKIASASCDSLYGWYCLENTTYAHLVAVNFYNPGIYEIAIVQVNPAATAAFSFGFVCEPPCHPVRNSKTVTNSPFNALRLQWEDPDGNGLWSYEVELRDEQDSVQTRVAFGPNIETYLFSMMPGQVYHWRVRKVCGDGSTKSDWTQPISFQTPYDCPTAALLDCWEEHTYTSATEPYVFWDNCSNAQQTGSTQIWKIVTATTGEYRLVVKNTNGRPVTYGLVAPDNCYNPIPNCVTVTDPDTISLGHLPVFKTYYLKIFQTDSTLASQTFELLCACPEIFTASGVLQADSSAQLNWDYETVGNFEIEFAERSVPFIGTPNYFSNQKNLLIPGLDPNKDYHYRVRVVCPTIAPWSAEIDLNKAFVCATVPVLNCDSPQEIYIGAGPGLNFSTFGGFVVTPGQERYLRLEGLPGGNYTLGIQRISGNANIKAALLEGCSSGGGSSGGPEIPLLQTNGYATITINPGIVYTLVLDNGNYLSGTYYIALNCDTLTPINDHAYDYALGGTLLAKPVVIDAPCAVFSNKSATTDPLDPNPTLMPGNWIDGPEKTVWFYFDAPAGGTVQVNVTSDSMDPQVALARFDSAGFFGYHLLATGEDLPGSANAQLIYTGLIPGERYLLMVDGVNGSTGDFCLEILHEPTLSMTVGVCQTFMQPPTSLASPQDWINLYASTGPHTNGPLLAAIQTMENLGTINIFTEVHPTAPVLLNGQKILPRYFNIEPEFQPVHPVKLRLFFTAEDLANYNLTPPVDSVSVPQLGITHYDGNSEDCDPNNNVLGGAGLGVNTATYEFVGQNGLFYLETTLAQFSEFGAAFNPASSALEPVALKEVRAYPVPTSDLLSLECFVPTDTPVRLQLSHLTGKIMLEQVWQTAAGNNVLNLDLGDFPAGFYLLNLQTKEGFSKTFKINKL